MNRFVTELLQNESGQDIIEYGLLAGLVSLLCVTVVVNVGDGVQTVYDGVESQAAALSN